MQSNTKERGMWQILTGSSDPWREFRFYWTEMGNHWRVLSRQETGSDVYFIQVTQIALLEKIGRGVLGFKGRHGRSVRRRLQ